MNETSIDVDAVERSSTSNQDASHPDDAVERDSTSDRDAKRSDGDDDDWLADLDLLVLSHGYQTFTKNQVDLLAERCNSVHVLVRYNRFADISEYLPIAYLRPHRKNARIDRTDQPDNVTVVPVPLLYLPIDYHYRQLGEKHYEHARDVVDDLDVDFDLIHCHFTWTSGYVGGRLSDDLDVPCVLTSHENENWLRDLHDDGPEGVYDAWRSVDAIIRVNEKDVPLFEAFNDSVYSIPNGFTRSEFPVYDRDEAREELDVPLDAELVFALGGLQERKRFHHLVDAMDVVADRREDARCAIAGQGSKKSDLEDQVESLGLEGIVDVLGYIPQEELALWMNAADVFALPSAAEGNPTVLFEALGCGTPYVGTNVGGVPEIITSEEYGLTCDPDDPDALARILLDGLEREWDREVILEYAEQFTWERIVEQVVDVYEDVLTRDQRAALAR